MTIIYDTNYGADADGNRGITVIDEWFVDDENAGYIRDYMFNNSDILEDKQYNECVNIPFDEVDDFAEVEISEYLSEEEYEQLTDDKG